MILTFEGNEEEMLNNIISCMKKEPELIRNINSNLVFQGLEIDELNRLIIRNNREIELTYTEFEILNLLAQPSSLYTDSLGY